MCRPFSTKSEEEYNVRGSTMSGFSIRSRLSTVSERERENKVRRRVKCQRKYNVRVQYKVKTQYMVRRRV